MKTRAAAADALAQACDPRLRLPKPGLGDRRWREYWVEVPAGEFWVGAQKHSKGRPDYDPEAEKDEDSKRSAPLAMPRFWLGRHPVTVFEYNEFLERENKQPHPEMEFATQFEHPGRPLVNITWEEAQEYCHWAGGRLPTEQEWEFAARGPNNWRYPWGNELGENAGERLANYSESSLRETSPVGVFPEGAQRENGILDLAGNVWEWTGSLYNESQPVRVVRGGSFDYSAWYLRSAYRDVDPPDVRVSNFGFRCLREVFP